MSILAAAAPLAMEAATAPSMEAALGAAITANRSAFRMGRPVQIGVSRLTKDMNLVSGIKQAFCGGRD